MTGWLVAVLVVLVAVVGAYLWAHRHPGRHREPRYPCERLTQRIRDWWAFVKARR